MRSTLIELLKGFLDLFLPNRCINCGSIVDSSRCPVPLCANHRSELTVLTEPLCHFCSRPLDGSVHEHYHYEIAAEPVCGSCRKRKLILDRVVAGYPFGGLLRNVVSDWKFAGRPEWGHWLGRRLAESLEDRVNWEEWEGLTPVPMHRRRREERGFNQALQLARGVSETTGLPVLRLLRKHRRTDPQSNLDRDERHRNLRGAFSMNPEQPVPAGADSILIVDDIYTTGSTLRTAAGVLQDEGVQKVGGLVLARTLRRST